MLPSKTFTHFLTIGALLASCQSIPVFAQTMPNTSALQQRASTTAQAGNEDLAAASSTQHVYMTNFATNAVLVCTGQKNLKGCKSFSDTIHGPTSIVLSPNKKTAYIANSTANTISVCAVKQDGSLANCAAQSSGMPSTFGLAVNPAGTYLFVTSNQNGSAVSSCRINPADGSFSDCVRSPSGPWVNPTSIAIDPSGKFALVTNYDGSQLAAGLRVQSCQIDPANGVVENCNGANDGFYYPTGVTFDKTGAHAYITGEMDSSVTVCNFNAQTGFFNGCSSSGAGGIQMPTGIAFKGNRVFIVDLLENGLSGAVKSCKANATSGLLSDCAPMNDETALPSDVVLN